MFLRIKTIINDCQVRTVFFKDRWQTVVIGKSKNDIYSSNTLQMAGQKHLEVAAAIKKEQDANAKT